MKIEGGFTVDAPIERVWQLSAIPSSWRLASPAVGQSKLPVPIATRLACGSRSDRSRQHSTLRSRSLKRSRPSGLPCITRGDEGGKANRLSAQFLTEVDGGRTEVRYSSEASIFGRLGRYGLGMMKKKADAMGADFAAAFAERVDAVIAAEKTQ